jgi:competence protein ComEA
VVVDVVGKVRHPGVYRLAADARVEDAIAAAGGVRPGFDTATLNLAARVSDGQLVAVGVAAAAPAGGASEPAGTGPSTGAAAGPVYLNSATLEQLDGLPGVGPVLAQHILDYRTQHGSFTSVDQLKDVSGIGPAKYAGLKDLVSV